MSKLLLVGAVQHSSRMHQGQQWDINQKIFKKLTAMIWYQRYITTLDLLTNEPESFSLGKIAALLKEKGITPSSVPTLSRWREYETIPKKKRTDAGIKTRFEKVTSGMEEILMTRNGLKYKYEENKSYYYDIDNEKNTKQLLSGKSKPDLEDVHDSGITKIWDGFPSASIRAGFGKSKKLIRILDTFLTEMENWQEAFSDAIRNGCHIHLLLAEPNSSCARLRSKSLKDVNVQHRVLGNLEQLESFCIKYPNQFLVRLYDHLPGLNLFAYDDTMILGWFWRHKYAIHGTYMQLQKNNSALAKDADEHWQEMWNSSKPYSPTAIDTKIIGSESITYNCYFIRDREVQTFQLSLDTQYNKVYLQRTKSGVDYQGDAFRLNGYTYIMAQTNPSQRRHHNDRIASFLINHGKSDELGKQDVAIAAYSNITPKGRAYANIMVMIKQTFVDGQEVLPTEQELQLIESYLVGSEISITDSYIDSLDDIKRALAAREGASKLIFISKLAGRYTLMVNNFDTSGEEQILTFPIDIAADGTVLFRGSTMLTSLGTVKVLNKQNILISKISEDGETSYFYVFQPVTVDLLQLSGYAVGVSRANRPKYCRAFLHKNEHAFEEKNNTYPVDSNFKLLEKLYGEAFRHWFTNTPDAPPTR